jgi:BirA family biotin operon repressor/biotin-[acetyl-CoA-carboxylase] ligase
VKWRTLCEKSEGNSTGVELNREYQEISLGISKGVGFKIIHYQNIDSTSTYLKKRHSDFPEGVVIWADTQTAGRGRSYRKWESPSGKGLYFSLLLKPQIQPKSIPLLSLMACLAVKRAIEICANEMSLEKQNLDIKWPNDIYINKKKIGGILLESIFYENSVDIILGVGLNIKSEIPYTDPEVRFTAGTLEEFYGGNWGFARLLKETLSQINRYYHAFNPEELRTEYRRECRMWGKTVIIQNEDWLLGGICRDIGELGELIIENNMGLHKILSGTVFIDW